MAITTTKRNKRTCLGRFQRRNMVAVKVNGLSSSHSGCAGGRKGWPLARFPVRRRLGRKGVQNLFRKACSCSGTSQPIGDKCFPKNARTCLEGPFGELLRATGPMARANPIRFSTKFQDDETDLIYYGYRYYDAYTGRWLNRDSLSEDGGLNLYVLAFNCAISKWDFLGLAGQGECGNVVPSYLEGVADKTTAQNILKNKFPNDPKRIARELKLWEKYRGLRGSSVIRNTKKLS